MSSLHLYCTFLTLFICSACQLTRPDSQLPEAPPTRPSPMVLTVILKADPALDTLMVANVLRAPGSMREDYPRSVSEPEEGMLLFSFLGIEDRMLRQTTMPFPGASRFEVPHEDGHIEEVTVPEAERVLLLRTNFLPSLHRLRITGKTPDGRPIDQLVELAKRW